jgi:hypothetical protein
VKSFRVPGLMTPQTVVYRRGQASSRSAGAAPSRARKRPSGPIS